MNNETNTKNASITTSEGNSDEAKASIDLLFQNSSRGRPHASSPISAHDTVFPDDPPKGKWIGIDLGTSNCCCAIWDTNKHKAKIIRLKFNNICTPEEDKYKPGYLIPSLLLFHDDNGNQNGIIPDVNVEVGNACVQAMDDLNEMDTIDTSKASIGSIKRILGVSSDMLDSLDSEIMDTLPFSYHIDENNSMEEAIQAVISPLSKNKEPSHQILVSPKQATALLLKSIKESVEKTLGESVKNTIIGVPAHYSQNQRNTAIHAARLAGFTGHVSTLTESTAASLSYGLFVSPSKHEKQILVVDIGGGTADVTVATILCDDDGEVQFRVKATAGNCRLGGDDVDQSILDFFLEETRIQFTLNEEKQSIEILRKKCRRAKEQLCNMILEIESEPKKYSNEERYEAQVAITFREKKVNLQLHLLENLLQTFNNQTESLIKNVLSQNETSMSIQEVILVGGSTNLPPLRTMLQKLFPHIQEFCTSVHPMKAVAQGCAIQCAIRSKIVPKHELRNIMMLDALPHSIGVRVNENVFVKILSKNDSLPARNYQTFRLADLDQKGVTVFAVEDVGDGYPLQTIGEFTFLLHKLSPEAKKALVGGTRSVDIGMTMDKNGKLMVSIFDWNDPEHLKSMKSYQENKMRMEGNNGHDLSDSHVLEYEEEGTLKDQILLMIACILIFFLYIAAKIAFSDSVFDGETL